MPNIASYPIIESCHRSRQGWIVRARRKEVDVRVGGNWELNSELVVSTVDGGMGSSVRGLWRDRWAMVLLDWTELGGNYLLGYLLVG